ncbi:MAG: hypothetical protein KN64_10720 [Sulfurovum sp. AS07-7]|nr:MAG: hypothetical protein KN64_10720 [Sulfurovum sp. AS07-7]
MKTKAILVRVTEEEHEKLHTQAKNCSMTLSQYLRNIGLNYPITSTIDQRAFSELLKLKGDFGRVGGLFKLWLSNNKHDQMAMLGKYSYRNIANLVEEIEENKKEILNIARKLL